MKLHRNTKFTRLNKHKKKLGTSILQRPIDIDNRKEFGHWEYILLLVKNLRMIIYFLL